MSIESSVALVKAIVPRPAPFGRGVVLGVAEGEAATSLGERDDEFDVVMLAAPQAVTTALAHSSSMTSIIVRAPVAVHR